MNYYNIYYMGYYGGVIHDEKNEDQVKFSMTDFHLLNNVLDVNKNLKFILHKSQYSDKFTIKNDTLDLDKDKIEINPKSIVKVDATGAPQGTIMVDSDDKLKLNYSSDFFTDYNSTLYLNIGPGLTRDADNKVSVSIAKCNLKFENNELCLDMNAMINDFNCIKLDDKQRLRLDYNADDFMKDSRGKLYLKLDDKHIVRTLNGLKINIDNDTICYDSNGNKLISKIDKYLGTFGVSTSDIYLDLNKKMRLNINNYVDDNVGSKVIMNTHNKIDLDIVDQQSGEIYFDSNNKLSLILGNYFSKDSSGHFFHHVNQHNGLNWNNYKLNLDVSFPLDFIKKKLTLSYNPYFKLTNNKLDLDITKLKSDIVIPKAGGGIMLNNDGTLSIDRNVLTSFINVSSLSGLKIIGNQLIVHENLMSSNLIRLDSNSSLKRRANNFYEIVYDRVSIDTDFVSGNLMVKPTYIPSIVNKTYIKNKIINESWYKDNHKYFGECMLKACSLCYWNLDDLSCIDKTISSSVFINKFQNYKYKHNDFYYFTTQNNAKFHYKHYSLLLFPDVVTDNYIEFNNTNQNIKYIDIFNKTSNLTSIMFNIVIEPEKKTIDINSTLFTVENDNYIKILYNNQGIVFKFGCMYENTSTTINEHNEIIVPTTESLLRKNVISFYYGVSPKRLYIIVNGNIIYDKNNLRIGGKDL